jgi:hypothetical protein
MDNAPAASPCWAAPDFIADPGSAPNPGLVGAEA